MKLKNWYKNENVLIILQVSIFILYIITLPKISYVSQDIFFYIKNLPPLYYFSLVFYIYCSLRSKKTVSSLLAKLFFSYLLMITPFIMFTNAWQMDSYIFALEPYFIKENAFIGSFHYVLESPILGLFFGPLVTITGINPLLLLKMYPIIVVSILTIIMFIIGSIIEVNEISILSPLFFISIMWPNTFHVNRQNFSLVFYCSSWLILLWIYLKNSSKKLYLLLFSTIFIMILAHPATPIYFSINILFVTVIGIISKQINKKEISSLIAIMIFTLSIWYIWNSQFESSNYTTSMQIIVGMATSMINSLLNVEFSSEGIEKITSGGYTNIYQNIISLRLALTVIITATAIAGLFMLFFTKENNNERKKYAFLFGWVLSNACTVFPLLLSGLPYFYRPALFVFISWGPIGAVIFDSINRSRVKKIVKSINVIYLIFFIFVPSVLLPIIKYTPINYLYPSNNELNQISYLGRHFDDLERNVILFEYTQPWGYPSMVDENDVGLISIYRARGDMMNNYLFITERYIVRDTYRIYIPSLSDIVKTVTTTYPGSTHNLIFNSGGAYQILMPQNVYTP